MWNEFAAEWRNNGTRPRIFMIAGIGALGLAVAGLMLPIIPQIPFAILAAYFFARGSRRLHQWIMDHKHMGPPVIDWENHRVLRPRLKVLSVLGMIGGGVIGHINLDLGWAIALDAIFLLCIAFVLTRKSMRLEQR